MNPEENGALRKTVLEIYNFIGENLYLNRPDIEVNGIQFNSALLMSLLTGLCNGKELIIGEPGLGKTTSAEYLCSLLYRFPLGTIWGSEVSGHPEQTEEKIIGRPDLGKLNQGEEFVVWTHFTLLPIKIVEARSDSLEIYMAKKAVNEMHRRCMEQGTLVKNALAVACRIAEGEALEPVRGDHPIYWEIGKDLGKEVLET